LTAKVWQKSEILVGTYMLLTPMFVTFLHGGPVQFGRESAHKSRAASGNTTLGDCIWTAQHLQEGYLHIKDFLKFDPLTATGMAFCVNLRTKCQILFPLVSD
jgi:hypothetical protein